MAAKTKYGLIVGAVSMKLNVALSALAGLCGPLIAVGAGAVAGYLTVQEEQPATRDDRMRAGAASGAIANSLVLLGQVGAAIISLRFLHREKFFDITDDSATKIGYYAGGSGVGLGIGLLGLLLGALAGAASGYFSSPEETAAEAAG